MYNVKAARFATEKLAPHQPAAPSPVGYKWSSIMPLLSRDIRRFWAKVNKNGPIHPSLGTPCWLWTASKSSGDYGRFKLNRRLWAAHRVVWIIARGSIPKGLDVLHHCDRPCCVNPDHLFVGTHAKNLQDCRDKGRLKVPDNSGENMGWHKLTWEEVLEARRLYKKGNRWHPSENDYVALARKYNVHPVTMRAAILGKTWKKPPSV